MGTHHLRALVAVAVLAVAAAALPQAPPHLHPHQPPARSATPVRRFSAHSHLMESCPQSKKRRPTFSSSCSNPRPLPSGTRKILLKPYPVNQFGRLPSTTTSTLKSSATTAKNKRNMFVPSGLAAA